MICVSKLSMQSTIKLLVLMYTCTLDNFNLNTCNKIFRLYVRGIIKKLKSLFKKNVHDSHIVRMFIAFL